MNDLVNNETGQPLTTSKVVADVFGKIHRDVVRSIKNLDCSDEFRARNFAQSTYVSPQNKELGCFTMTKNGFSFLCMGFTGEKAAQWKEMYIEAFDEMAASVLTIDNRMNQLSNESSVIKRAGKEWSAMGNEIKKAKKKNKLLCDELVSEVQGNLFLESK